METMPATEVVAPEWARDLPGAVELYEAIRKEFPLMNDHCIWELVRNW